MPRDIRTLKEKVTAFLARHGGNAEAAVTELLTDNARYRERIRSTQNSETPYRPDARIVELEGENDRLEMEVTRLGNLIPGQGAVVLSAGDAKVWESYRALGKPEDVKVLLDEVPTLRTTVSDTTRERDGRSAAKLLGWNEDATVGAIRDKGLVVSLVDGKDKDGKAVKVPHVRPASDEKAATVPLSEYVEQHASYLTPALTATGGATSSTQTTQPLRFPAQSAGGSPAAPTDPVKAFQQASQAARDARPNPLVPRTVAATT